MSAKIWILIRDHKHEDFCERNRSEQYGVYSSYEKAAFIKGMLELDGQNDHVYRIVEHFVDAVYDHMAKWEGAKKLAEACKELLL